MTIEFKPLPPGGASHGDPDGSYIYHWEGRVQVVVVGPMEGSPAEYERAVMDLPGHDAHQIESSSVLPPGDGVDYKTCLRRGFMSMIFAVPKPRRFAEGVEHS